MFQNIKAMKIKLGLISVFLFLFLCQCSENKEESIPREETVFKVVKNNLVRIRMKNLEVHKLPYDYLTSEFIHFDDSLYSQVSSLEIDLDGINKIDKSIYKCVNIANLELKEINADSIDIDYSAFQHLRFLKLEMKEGATVFKNTFVNDTVISVSLIGCPSLKSIGPGLNGFPNVSSLTFKFIPSETTCDFKFAEFRKVHGMNFFSCPISEFPGDLLDNQSVFQIDFTGCDFSSLPKDLGSMHGLRSMSFRANKFKEIPVLDPKYMCIFEDQRVD